MRFALDECGLARMKRGVVSSGVSLDRQFGISATAATVAVVSSAVDADGTAISTGITGRGGNSKASLEESNTAALGNGNTGLM
ncbi:hypothetical protein TSMEX_011131 [Taenia solium]|eukprot:TsM_000720200 transcript=TsM_000720200 gene=TsM_000720200